MELLSIWQSRAKDGDLANSMKAFVLWLESKLDCKKSIAKYVAMLTEHFEDFRKMIREELVKSGVAFHDRIPDACADLFVAFSEMTRFYRATNIMSMGDLEALSGSFYSVIIELATKQCELIKHRSNAEVFIEIISSMLASDFVQIPSKQNCSAIRDEVIGYRDDLYFYLNMEATYKMARRFCLEQNEPPLVGKNILLKELAEDGFIIVDKGKTATKVVKLVNGKSVRIAVFSRKNFDENKSTLVA